MMAPTPSPAPPSGGPPPDMSAAAKRTLLVDGVCAWALIDGYPWWPTVVRCRRKVEGTLEPTDTLPPATRDNRLVEFFNDGDHVAVVELENLQEYTGARGKLEGAADGGFAGAVREACGMADAYIRDKGASFQRERLEAARGKKKGKAKRIEKGSPKSPKGKAATPEPADTGFPPWAAPLDGTASETEKERPVVILLDGEDEAAGGGNTVAKGGGVTAKREPETAVPRIKVVKPRPPSKTPSRAPSSASKNPSKTPSKNPSKNPSKGASKASPKNPTKASPKPPPPKTPPNAGETKPTAAKSAPAKSARRRSVDDAMVAATAAAVASGQLPLNGRRARGKGGADAPAAKRPRSASSGTGASSVGGSTILRLALRRPSAGGDGTRVGGGGGSAVDAAPPTGGGVDGRTSTDADLADEVASSLAFLQRTTDSFRRLLTRRSEVTSDLKNLERARAQATDDVAQLERRRDALERGNRELADYRGLLETANRQQDRVADQCARRLETLRKDVAKAGEALKATEAAGVAAGRRLEGLRREAGEIEGGRGDEGKERPNGSKGEGEGEASF